MAIDYDAIARAGGIPKSHHRTDRHARKRAEAAAWRDVCKLVDARDRRVCQVTRLLLSPRSPDAFRALERHHLEFRSASKAHRYMATNVWTVARGVHFLIHDGKLLLLDKDGEEALDVRAIHAVKWNREKVARGAEPCRIRFARPAA